MTMTNSMSPIAEICTVRLVTTDIFFEILRFFFNFYYPQFCATRARVDTHFRFGRGHGLPGHRHRLRFSAFPPCSSLLQGNHSPHMVGETTLHRPVGQRLEGDHGEPSARLQKPRSEE